MIDGIVDEAVSSDSKPGSDSSSAQMANLSVLQVPVNNQDNSFEHKMGESGSFRGLPMNAQTNEPKGAVSQAPRIYNNDAASSMLQFKTLEIEHHQQLPSSCCRMLSAVTTSSALNPTSPVDKMLSQLIEMLIDQLDQDKKNLLVKEIGQAYEPGEVVSLLYATFDGYLYHYIIDENYTEQEPKRDEKRLQAHNPLLSSGQLPKVIKDEPKLGETRGSINMSLLAAQIQIKEDSKNADVKSASGENESLTAEAKL